MPSRAPQTYHDVRSFLDRVAAEAGLEVLRARLGYSERTGLRRRQNSQLLPPGTKRVQHANRRHRPIFRPALTESRTVSRTDRAAAVHGAARR